MTRACLGRARGALAAIILLLAPINAAAQRPEPRFELSGGGLFVGGYSLGSKDADLVTNQTGGPPYALFQADTDVDSTFGFEARVGVRLSRFFVAEGGILASRPRMATRLRSDVEGAPDTTATQDLSMYIIDGAILARFGTGRLRPFVRVGAGYLRELHNDNSLVETGTAFHAGGGATFWLSEKRRRFGVRADARVYILRDGISLGDGSRTIGAGGAGVVFGF